MLCGLCRTAQISERRTQKEFGPRLEFDINPNEKPSDDRVDLVLINDGNHEGRAYQCRSVQ